MKILLIIEDSPDDLLLTLRALKELNVELDLQVAVDGEQAIEFVCDTSRSTPDLVLLDLKLPKRNGLEVLEVIRANPTTNQLAVVILSSSIEPSDIARASALGVDEYVQKPVDYLKYKEVVRRVVKDHLRLI